MSTRSGEVDDFTIGGATGNTPPSSFALILPVDGDTLNGDNTTFLWSSATDIDPSSTVMYEFYIDVDSLFPSGPFVTDLDDTVLTLDTSAFDDTIYYWRVIAFDQYNDRTPSQELFSLLFKTESGVVTIRSRFHAHAGGEKHP